MNGFILTAAAALALINTASSVPPKPAPDFSWQDNCSGSARAHLIEAKAKWDAATALPDSPILPADKHTCAAFDDSYVYSVLAQPDFLNQTYVLLDTAMRRDRLINECKELYEKAITESKPANSDALLSGMNTAYYYLHSTAKLAAGVARAGVSQRMASSHSSSYCFQAMELAIDALRDSANDAEQVPDGKQRAEFIRKFRAHLFSVWDSAQRTKDMELINRIDLLSVFSEAFPQAKNCTKSKPASH